MDLDFASLFKKAIQEMGETGDEYAEAKAQSWYQQEMKGAVIANIIKEKFSDLPVSRAELAAKASPEYLSYLKETATAIKREGMTKSKHEKSKARFEGYRSLCSLEKKIIQNIGE